MHAIDRLVVLAGPSGVGKTTFLGRLEAGSLAAEIGERVPQSAATWTQLNPRAHRQWLPKLRSIARSGPPLSGATLQIELTALRDEPAEVVPSMQAVEVARDVIVIDLTAPARRIAQQFLDRECRFAVQDNPAAAPAIDGLRRAFLTAPGSTAMDRLAIASAALGAGIPERYARRLAYYRRPAWLDEVNATWHRVVATTCAGRTLGMLRIESTPGMADGFRLQEAATRSFPAAVETAVP